VEREGEKERAPGFQYLLQGHTQSDLTSFSYDLPSEVTTTSQRHQQSPKSSIHKLLDSIKEPNYNTYFDIPKKYHKNISQIFFPT
jgi:hypothetical protein